VVFIVMVKKVTDEIESRLSHIVHGPHDANFHALWNQLREEHYQLTLKGYTGEGFLSEGKRLGGKRIPHDEVRRIQRAAAEKRRALGGGSGQRLGGAPVLVGQDIRKVIADAAERRMTVMKGCGSGNEDSKAIVDQATNNGFRTKAEEEDANDRAIVEAYMELLQEEEREVGESYIPSSQHTPGPNSTDESATSRKGKKRSSGAVEPDAIDLTEETEDMLVSDKSQWDCPVCTLRNPFQYLCCDACGNERPTHTKPKRNPRGNSILDPSEKSRVEVVQKPSHWICHGCGTAMESQWWTCSMCGQMKLSS
jgi:hypothetical protein